MASRTVGGSGDPADLVKRINYWKVIATTCIHAGGEVAIEAIDTTGKVANKAVDAAKTFLVILAVAALTAVGLLTLFDHEHSRSAAASSNACSVSTPDTLEPVDADK
jgi:hypothetical protein